MNAHFALELSNTLKLLSSCLEKPWLWIIFICLIRVLFPLSAAPDTQTRETLSPQNVNASMQPDNGTYITVWLTKHEDSHHSHLSPGMFTEILLYFRALEFSFFAFFRDILVEAHSHADLRKNSVFSHTAWKLWDCKVPAAKNYGCFLPLWLLTTYLEWFRLY